MWHFIDVCCTVSIIWTFLGSTHSSAHQMLCFSLFSLNHTHYMETIFLATIVLNTIWPCPHLTSTSSTCRFCREHTEIISKEWLTSDHMTAHMIQPPDQVDDIIQGEYNMSQVPTGLLWLLEKTVIFWTQIVASFPGCSGTRTCVRGESLVSFLVWQNRTRVFRTERQHFSRCSTNYVFNAWCV